MKFLLIDKIESVEPGQKIVTSKQLTLAEEYLGDHFPTFPVMPGVLMLEGLTQSAAWLVRLEQDFACSVIHLSSARNVKYAYFLRPGNTIRYEVEAMRLDETTAKLKGNGYVGDRLAVAARLELTCYNLADRMARGAEIDRDMIDHHRRTFALLGGPAAMQTTASA